MIPRLCEAIRPQNPARAKLIRRCSRYSGGGGSARQSNGHVTLHSNLGQGITVSIYLPVATDDATTQTDAPKDITPLMGRNQRVLVVKDNARIGSLTCERLEALGYRTLAAEIADQALETLNAGCQIDVLFTDLIAPASRDGFDLAMRARSNFPQLKIILTTGYGPGHWAKTRWSLRRLMSRQNPITKKIFPPVCTPLWRATRRRFGSHPPQIYTPFHGSS